MYGKVRNRLGNVVRRVIGYYLRAFSDASQPLLLFLPKWRLKSASLPHWEWEQRRKKDTVKVIGLLQKIRAKCMNDEVRTMFHIDWNSFESRNSPSCSTKQLLRLFYTVWTAELKRSDPNCSKLKKKELICSPYELLYSDIYRRQKTKRVMCFFLELQ